MRAFQWSPFRSSSRASRSASAVSEPKAPALPCTAPPTVPGTVAIHSSPTIPFRAAAAATLAFAVPLWTSTDNAQVRAIWPTDTHLQSDSAVADFVRTHTQRSERIYVLWAAADLYYLSERRPTLRYLWLRNVQTIRGVVASVRRLLDRRAAALVVVEQAPASVDPSGATALALDRNYRFDARVDGVDVYRRRR